MASGKCANDWTHSHLPWIDEQPDQTARALEVHGGTRRRDLRGDFVLGQTGRQFLRIEVGGDKNESIVVRRGAGRRTGAGIEADALGALAADIFVGRL